MERKIRFAPEEYYHIYNRGVEKRKIFQDTKDYQRFLHLLYLGNSAKTLVFKEISDNNRYSFDVGTKIVSVGAYVCMPNHFHLLIKATTDKGISEFLRKISTAYTMYFNKKYKRVGPLFQGKFKAAHISDDEYLKYMYSYIHLNPAKIVDPNWREAISEESNKKLLDFIKAYPYSSFADYLVERPQSTILSKEDFPEYFEGKEDIAKSLTDWLDYSIAELPRSDLGKGYLLM